jgi:hypothetical protein
MVVGVNSNYMVHLDLLPLVLCVRIGGGCWWVMASCDFVQLNSILCNSNTFTTHETLAMTLFYLHLIWLLVAKVGFNLCLAYYFEK